MTISLLERVGPMPAGRSVARRLRVEIETGAASGTVRLDVSGIEVMAPSFADELFAKLDPALESTGRVEVVGVPAALEPLLRMVRRRRPAAA